MLSANESNRMEWNVDYSIAITRVESTGTET